MWRLFMLIAVACGALLLWPEALLALRWQRGALSEGQVWRMLSAHFAHLDAWHAIANLAGLALVIEWLSRSVKPAEAMFVMLVSAVTIIAGLALLDPAVNWYAGLSGVVHGVWAGFALLGSRRDAMAERGQQAQAKHASALPGELPTRIATGLPKRLYVSRCVALCVAPRTSLPAAALGVLLLKLALPPLPCVPSLPWLAASRALPVVPQSHLYGALGGAIAALVLMAAASCQARRMKSGLE